MRRQLVVSRRSVRQPGVRVAGGERRADARQSLDEGPHLRRAQRAVDADDERLGVLDRDPERLDGWPDRLRPLRSMAVKDSQSGTPGATSSRPRRAFAFSVSNNVSTSSRSTPPSTSPRTCSA